ncbi:MAG: DUF3572 domain-containing protein [Hyphomicrobiaceae bacterium]|nr:DUF3572 domain-containing protein [Hyphomicrobiaceae bacterium]
MSLQHEKAREVAETIALKALAFLAASPDRLGRFLALTGIGPSELRQQVSSPQMLAGILDHVMQDETLLMVFAAETGLKPESVAAAHRALSGPEPERTP